ncbi:MAG: S41 family peptidase [Planctomycetes bacterium]|nr:S41 family peptidase [Planctomycetota bacterium]
MSFNTIDLPATEYIYGSKAGAGTRRFTRLLALLLAAAFVAAPCQSAAEGEMDRGGEAKSEAGKKEDKAKKQSPALPTAEATEAGAQDDDVPVVELVTTLLKDLPKQDLDEVWDSVARLVRLGQTYGAVVTDRLLAELPGKDEKVRLTVARALSRLNAMDEAQPVLLDLLLNAESPKIRALTANVIGKSSLLYDKHEVTEALMKALGQERDPMARIDISRTAWRYGKMNEGRDALMALMMTAREKAVRDEATLVLAEMGMLKRRSEWSGKSDEPVYKAVQDRIVLLAHDPTPRGERAFNLYREVEIGARTFRDERMQRGMDMLKEVLLYVRGAYPDFEKDLFTVERSFESELNDRKLTDGLRDVFARNGVMLKTDAAVDVLQPGYWQVRSGEDKYLLKQQGDGLQVCYDKYDLDTLFEDAGKGLISGLDPFSQYLDREEVKETQEILAQGYGGIGAYVGVRNGVFTIISPIYNSPADKAGLKSLDQILEVDGQKTSGLMDNGGMSKVIAQLKGDPGTKVKVKFFRRGFREPHEVTLERAEISVDTVTSELLPGRIGYVRLTRFGDRSYDELKHAVDDLLENQKAKAIVLDLRNNPGGLLKAGVQIADRFLADGKLIVYSEGRKEFAPYRPYHATGGASDEAFPMVCLVNSGSASASEIVAGALKVHKRALLVGEKTYGKGSVQQIIPLSSTGRETHLRLTIAKYYLPDGHCIHEAGIQPDVAVEPEKIDDWTIKQIFELRENHLIEDFVTDHWTRNRDLYMKIAKGDAEDAAACPDFGTLWEKIAPYRLEKLEVLREMRRNIRRVAQDDVKKEFACDLSGDETLQRGVLELLKKLDVNPASIAEFRRFAPEAAKPKDGALGAMLPPGEPAPPEGAAPKVREASPSKLEPVPEAR